MRVVIDGRAPERATLFSRAGNRLEVRAESATVRLTWPELRLLAAGQPVQTAGLVLVALLK